MCIYIKYRVLGFLMVLALVVWGCGVTDESAERGGALGAHAGPEDGVDGSAEEEYETRAVDPLLPNSKRAGGSPVLAGLPGLVVACAQGDACQDLSEEGSWCGLPGGCEDRFEEGDEDIDPELPGGEDECLPVNGGVEICDGIDDDCDGLVDNIYLGGRLSARADLTCVTSRTGALRCMGDGPAVGDWPATPARLGQVSAGGEHGCALGADAQVYCWGNNQYGQTLPGGPEYVSEPTHVALNADILKVESGAYHSCALTQIGEVYCWGRNQYSQFGDGTSVPHDGVVEIAAELDFIDLSLGADHACAATSQGRVLCWGANHYGQTGQRDFRAINVPAWVDIPEFITQVSAGKLHTCALSEHERVYCWGNNEHGQLGDETTESRRQPRSAGQELLFVSVTAGGSRTCALSASGSVYCWGNNALGSLGVDGSDAIYPEPTSAAGALEFTEIQAGGEHSCGLTLQGYLLCWGRAQEGQLGSGVQTQQRQPRRVTCDD